MYGAIAVVILLLGARWIRAAGEAGDPTGDVAFASAGGEGAGTGNEAQFAIEGGGDDAVVHVAGAVRASGVYRLPAGSRVTDAVERAGGATPEAALDGINLAARLADGQQVIVPSRSGAAAVGAAQPAADAPISLGSATLEQLDTIEGIGPVTAQNIISFRDEHGGLSSVDELDEVSGIGPATMEALRARLQP